MILTMMFLLGSSAGVPQNHEPPATVQDGTRQSVNGGKPQTVKEDAHSRAKERREHWNDGMNTKRAPDPRERDEYGTPKVTPPKGQGTDNAGGLPPAADTAKSRK
ncbi:hypothetical protein SAMN02800692_2963 [Luteibacter sp. UNC138MFCol5.1]|uniref:hypothetical protein n=1 Tax=Luteibacter sp. UNC138MFCol5.1 TaxID=1502774 RepID=UPI0008C8AAEA|nr:hypothetical protein [Luteibacter sp. UNC138MFCol5.1]SEO94986.1 hypothetical protein SAMN02800692_2963 [Luteibacter sp. UNC138MFCol5.1]